MLTHTSVGSKVRVPSVEAEIAPQNGAYAKLGKDVLLVKNGRGFLYVVHRGKGPKFTKVGANARAPGPCRKLAAFVYFEHALVVQRPKISQAAKLNISVL